MPGINYNKWDSIVDSDEEEIKKQERVKSYKRDEFPHQQSQAVDLDIWLKQRFRSLAREEARDAERSSFSYGSPVKKPPPPTLTDEQRKTLSHFIVLAFAREGEHNLDSHVEILETLRHQSWICKDTTLDLMCRLHNQLLRQASKSEKGDDIDEDLMGAPQPRDTHFRDMVFSAVNTIAGPIREKCSPFEFISEICTPESERARKRREKYQERKYAKDALFDSLCGDLNLKNDDDDEGDDDWTDFWLFCGMFVLFAVLVIGAVVLLWYNNPSTPRKSKKNGTETTLTTTLTETLTTTVLETVSEAIAGGDVGKSEL